MIDNEVKNRKVSQLERIVTALLMGFFSLMVFFIVGLFIMMIASAIIISWATIWPYVIVGAIAFIIFFVFWYIRMSIN